MHYCRPSTSTAPLLHPPPAVGWVIITACTISKYLNVHLGACTRSCKRVNTYDTVRLRLSCFFLQLRCEKAGKGNDNTCVQCVGCSRVFNRQVKPRLRNCAQTDRLEGWNGGINCNMSHMTAHSTSF